MDDQVQISRRFTYTKLSVLEADRAFVDVQQMLQAKVGEAISARIRTWERATLEAAFDAGLDIRTPWGADVAAFATFTWNAMVGPRHERWPMNPAQFAILRNFDS